MFIDRATIHVRAGKGGDGSVHFYRGKALPKGGPDGGDGGDGGSVVFAADEGVNTLIDFQGNFHWIAKDGEPGRGKQMFGAAADDLVIRVPAGTQVYHAESAELLADVGPGDRVVIARGGKGGRGNERFKSSTNQTPRHAEPGAPGEEFMLRLELKLIADVGLIGMPNAGKSTLLAALTRARPKIADYPFTTLSPVLGVAELSGGRRLVLADIPGLIEGASKGAGLGHDFLRHVERTRVLVHVLDASPPGGASPADNYRTIRNELAAYAPALAEKPEVIAINKTDLLGDPAEIDRAVAAFCRELRLGADVPVLPISGATGAGSRELLEHVWKLSRPIGAAAPGWPGAPES